MLPSLHPFQVHIYVNIVIQLYVQLVGVIYNYEQFIQVNRTSVEIDLINIGYFINACILLFLLETVVRINV